VNKYDLFVLEALKAWATSGYEAAKTIHHRGFGRFVVDGKTLMLQCAMR